MLGSAIVLGITVITMGGVALVLSEHPGPVDAPRATFQLTLEPGAGLWGGGDEEARLHHLGGPAIDDVATTIQLRIRGVEARYGADTGPGGPPSPLGSGFSDGRLTIGEVWAQTTTIPPGAEVDWLVLANGAPLGAGSTVAPMTAGGCGSDTTPPTVTVWAQSPSDVTTATTGPVQVDLTAFDAGSGVDDAAPVHLYYRLDDGAGPAFTDLGPMTPNGTHHWTADIPVNLWLPHLGRTLEYYASPLTDLSGNAGGSANRTDLVQLVGDAENFVSSAVANPGTISAFGNAQSDADAGAEATFREADNGQGGGGSAVLTLDADGVNVAQTDVEWQNPSNALVQDDNDATVGSRNRDLQLTMTDAPQGSAGTITKVELKARVRIVPFTNDEFRLQACFDALCGAHSPEIDGAATYVTLAWDATAAHPLALAQWSWSDIDALEVMIESRRTGREDGTWSVDRVWVEVTHEIPGATTYGLAATLDWTGVVAGTTQTLALQYRVTNAETYTVQVWNGLAWNTRGDPLTATTSTLWTYDLAVPAEYNLGAPRVRIVDADPVGEDRGEVFLDFAKVVTFL